MTDKKVANELAGLGLAMAELIRVLEDRGVVTRSEMAAAFRGVADITTVSGHDGPAAALIQLAAFLDTAAESA
jgi:hypothetical protein